VCVDPITGEPAFHGTVIASIIASQNPEHPEVAPGVEIYNVIVFSPKLGCRYAYIPDILRDLQRVLVGPGKASGNSEKFLFRTVFCDGCCQEPLGYWRLHTQRLLRSLWNDLRRCSGQGSQLLNRLQLVGDHYRGDTRFSVSFVSGVASLLKEIGKSFTLKELLVALATSAGNLGILMLIMVLLMWYTMCMLVGT